MTGDTYGFGETIEITVTFDKAVTVNTSGGTPRIQFRLDGNKNRWAEYSSGSGGTALVFTYTVLAGDMDTDGIWLAADFLQLRSGTIRDATDNTVAATLTYDEPGLQTEHKVDGSRTTTVDATLRILRLSGVTLDPTFVSTTETYTATVVNSVTETTVTATPTHSGATVAFKDGADIALTNPVTLAEGANVIKAVVTSEDTTTMKTYMVTVTRGTTTAPEIVADGVQVTSMPATDETYGRGETIEITVTFDNAVTVDTSGGTPRIAFRLDGDPNPNRWAEYSRGSEGTALVFTYTVLADDMDDRRHPASGEHASSSLAARSAPPPTTPSPPPSPMPSPASRAGTRWTARSSPPSTMTTRPRPRRPRSSPAACRSPRRDGHGRHLRAGRDERRKSRSPSTTRSRWTRPAARPGSRSASTGICSGGPCTAAFGGHGPDVHLYGAGRRHGCQRHLACGEHNPAL